MARRAGLIFAAASGCGHCPWNQWPDGQELSSRQRVSTGTARRGHGAAAARADAAGAGAGGAAVGALTHAAGTADGAAGVAGVVHRAGYRAAVVAGQVLKGAGGLREQGQGEEFILRSMLSLIR